MVNLMLPPDEVMDTFKLSTIVPRLGLMYALLMQCRYPDLSLAQRVLSMIMTDSLAPVQVIISTLHNNPLFETGR